MMQHFLEYKTDIAMLLMRVVLGMLFFFQGFEKIFGMGLKQSDEGVADALHNTKLPKGIVKPVVAASSFVELFGGVLLVVGLFIYPVLCALSADLILVVFAMSLRESLWDMRYVWPRLVLVCALLLLPASWDRISVDWWVKW